MHNELNKSGHGHSCDRVTARQKKNLTTEDVKRIVDDEQVEQLTVQLCRHWEVATERLEGLPP